MKIRFTAKVLNREYVVFNKCHRCFDAIVAAPVTYHGLDNGQITWHDCHREVDIGSETLSNSSVLHLKLMFPAHFHPSSLIA